MLNKRLSKYNTPAIRERVATATAVIAIGSAVYLKFKLEETVELTIDDAGIDQLNSGEDGYMFWKRGKREFRLHREQ